MQTNALLMISIGLLLCGGLKAGADTVSGLASLSGKAATGGIVVYLDGPAKGQPLSKAIVDQRDKMFEPHISVVTRGTTVHFPNDDTVFHNVFAYFQAKKFDLGMYPRGVSKQVTFDRTGLVVLLCNIHSDMSAYIMVVDTPYYAVTDKRGRFHIAGVPSGGYTLRAWHESGAQLTQAVVVKPGDTSLVLALARK